MKRGLEKHGFNVDGFTDPLQALKSFRANHYYQIVTDIRMPIMNGFEFARAIYAKDQSANICFLTSFEILEDEAKKVFSSLPSHCFVKKPITPSELANHIRSRDLDS